MRKILMSLLSVLLVCTSCSNEADDAYAHERAFLKFPYANDVAPLFTALNNSGQWCCIELGTSGFVFKTFTQSGSYPYTSEIKNYGQPQCVAGFVVGKSSLPDMNMQYPVMAYDLVCPVCYSQRLITRKLTLSAPEQLTCTKCKHTFDLSNSGLSSDGNRLLRYRTALYSPSGSGMLVVMN